VTPYDPEYAPVVVVLLIGKEPPTPKENVPADPSAELKVCEPLAVGVNVTVSAGPGPVIEKLAGTVSENTCPPSPETEYDARDGVGEFSPIAPVPVTDRTPVALFTVTVPVPVLGLTIFPNAKPVAPLSAIGRKTLALASPDVDPTVGTVGLTAT